MQNFCFQSQITLLKVEDFAYSSRKQRWNSQRRLRSSLINGKGVSNFSIAYTVRFFGMAVLKKYKQLNHFP